VTSRLRGLVDACHPLPTLAVTSVVALLSSAAGRAPGGVVLMALATLVGQLSVGWCNDAYDAPRDRAAARTEKPTVRDDVTPWLLWRLALGALVLTVPLSYAAAGVLGGTAHVVAVLSAWAYDLALKTTVLSWLPYAVSFGLVPAFVTLGLTPAQQPATWLSGAAALLGVAAHLANALPDLESDEAVGAGGVVARLGRRGSGWLALVCLVAAVALLSPHLGAPAAVTTAGVVVVGAGAVLVGVRGRGLFRYVMLVAVVAVVALLFAARASTA
jgi:4-hydroxybenzoate polyprenyltransferase